jgi:hypothetical protein
VEGLQARQVPEPRVQPEAHLQQVLEQGFERLRPVRQSCRRLQWIEESFEHSGAFVDFLQIKVCSYQG